MFLTNITKEEVDNVKLAAEHKNWRELKTWKERFMYQYFYANTHDPVGTKEIASEAGLALEKLGYKKKPNATGYYKPEDYAAWGMIVTPLGETIVIDNAKFHAQIQARKERIELAVAKKQEAKEADDALIASAQDIFSSHE